MGKGSHQVFKDKAKNRLSDLQGMFTDLQTARQHSRNGDVAVLEEQVHQMLREWKAELNDPSPASSLNLGNNNNNNSFVGSDLSSEIRRLLQIGEEAEEEKDDATSKLGFVGTVAVDPKPEPEPLEHNNNTVFQEEYYVNQQLPEHGYLGTDEYKNILPTGLHHAVANYPEGAAHFDYQQFNLHQEMSQNHYLAFDASGQSGDNVPSYQDLSHFSDLLPAICPPPAAFLRPKCALWDCARPAQGLEWCQDYCSSFHATVALNEGPPGMTPVLRPGGIDLKDGPLFAALAAKTLGKSVGIPECEGAATTKSPWNAPELFDLSVLEGETLREWLFFDKPRRAFESGNRKQRSLPDYNGRGWHESRKQVMKEFGGLKRSYYMDPQPPNNYEWHLYEYEINDCHACALYRLELKFVDGKKSPKAKVTSDSLVDLQQQMGRLNAESVMDNRWYAKGRAKTNQEGVTENFCSTAATVNQPESGPHGYQASNQMASINKIPVYGPHLPYGYSIESLNNYYGT